MSDRKTYTVRVRRIEHREQDFQVKNMSSSEEAELHALEMASNHDFHQNSVSHSEEEIVDTAVTP